MGDYDVAQVCLKGHVVTDRFNSVPSSRTPFCPECGATTITACKACGASIRGEYHADGVGVIDGEGMRAPSSCHVCGKAYPWTRRRRRGGAAGVRGLGARNRAAGPDNVSLDRLLKRLKHIWWGIALSLLAAALAWRGADDVLSLAKQARDAVGLAANEPVCRFLIIEAIPDPPLLKYLELQVGWQTLRSPSVVGIDRAVVSLKNFDAEDTVDIVFTLSVVSIGTNAPPETVSLPLRLDGEFFHLQHSGDQDSFEKTALTLSTVTRDYFSRFLASAGLAEPGCETLPGGVSRVIETKYKAPAR